MTRKRVIRAVIGVLIMTLLTVVGVEAALYIIDPLGVMDYLYGLSHLITIPNEEGYTLAPGRVEFRRWSFTIDEQGNRLMPASEGTCTIAFVGDSVTFGFGVDDDKTFPYLLASEMPQVQFINLGKTAYNLQNIVSSVTRNSVDGYFYFVSENDSSTPWMNDPRDYGIPREEPPRVSALRYYYEFFAVFTAPENSGGASNQDQNTFWQGFDALWTRRNDDMAFAVMESPLADEMVGHYPTLLVVPRWTYQQQNSWADYHPNAAGHRYLAEQVREPLRALIARRCPEQAGI